MQFSAREKHAMNELDSYIQLSSSSTAGLMRRVLNVCLNVLQGCRMMELWTVKEESVLVIILFCFHLDSVFI
jgi:hypothetical protein